MVSVTARNDGSNGNGRDHVSRGEAAAHVGDAMEESVRITPSTEYILRAPPSGHAVHHGAEHFGIGDSFAGEEGGLLHIGIAAVEADHIKRDRNGDRFGAGCPAAERPIKAAERFVVIEIGGDVGVGG